MTVTTMPLLIDRRDTLKQRIQEDQRELDKLNTEAAMAARDRIQKQTIASLDAAAKAAAERVDGFDALIASAFENLKREVTLRRDNWAGRLQHPEASVKTNSAAASLIHIIHGKLEAESTAQQSRQRSEDASRIPLMDRR